MTDKDPNPYESKQEARRERLTLAAAEARARSGAAFDRARKIADAIPCGQPILAGHHSEARHRADVGRIDRGMRAGVDEAAHAEDLARRAEAIGTGGISSDDPDAVEKLRAELAELEAAHARDKAWNKGAIGDPIPGYVLSNRGANMRRIKARIEELEARYDEVSSEYERAGVRVVDDVEANRLQLIFPGKPDDETRGLLKASGFRWSPTAGAWQRMRSPGANHAAKILLDRIETVDS